VRFLNKLLATLAPAALVATLFTAMPMAPAPAEAAPPGSAFDPGLIISDSVFYDFGTMTAADIQRFLDSRVQNCRSGPGEPPCLKDFVGEIPAQPAAVGRCSAIEPRAQATAAEMIHIIATACGINPQALIVTLQKEQGIVTSTKPTDYMYRAAMGYGCPDSDPAICGRVFVGLFNQVYRGASQLRWYGNPAGSFTWLRPGRDVSVRYHPRAACGSLTFPLKSQATAALYYYTPYTPNRAALDNLYGTGDSCSAYGNRNFWRFFHDWFGSPIGGGFLLKTATSETFLITADRKHRITDTRLLAALRPLGPIGVVSAPYLDSFVTAEDMTQLVTVGDSRFLLVDGVRYAVPNCDIAAQFGQSCDNAVTLASSQLLTFLDGGELTRLVQVENGARYWIENGTKREVIDPIALEAVVNPVPAATRMNLDQVPALTFGAPLASDLVLFGVTGSRDRVIALQGRLYRFSGDLLSEVPLGDWFTTSTARVTQDVANSLTAGDTISGFVVSSAGQGFVLVPEGKRGLANISDWVSNPALLPDAILNRIPDAPGDPLVSPTVVTNGLNSFDYFIVDGVRRTSTNPAMTARFGELLGKSSLVSVPFAAISQLTNGGLAIAPGSLVRTSATGTIFLVDGLGHRIPMVSAAQAASVSNSQIFTFSSTFVSRLATRPALSGLKVSCGGSDFLVDTGGLWPIGTSTAQHYPGTSYRLADSTCLALGIRADVAPIGQLLRDQSGLLWFVENGTKRRIANWAAYQTLAGSARGFVNVSNYFVSRIPTGPAAPATTTNLVMSDNWAAPTFNGALGAVSTPATTTPTATPTPSPTPTPTPTPSPTATPAPTPAQAPTTGTQSVEYIVQSGDTLLRIANRFGVTTQQIISFNSISNPNLIRVGQRLLIPTSTASAPATVTAPTPTPAATATPTPSPTAAVRSYTVVGGDTLFSIARRFGVTVAALAELNSITNANLIRIGQRLQIPAR